LRCLFAEKEGGKKKNDPPPPLSKSLSPKHAAWAKKKRPKKPHCTQSATIRKKEERPRSCDIGKKRRPPEN